MYAPGTTVPPNTVVGCDTPGDCPGQKCCAVNNPVSPQYPDYLATSCKAACDADTEVPVCAVDTDCPSGGLCFNTGVGFAVCA
jgi:hypothetical protein